MSAYSNTSNLNSGFATGSTQDQYVASIFPYTYIICPLSMEESTNLTSTEFNVTQQNNQPTWVTTANNPTGYSLVNNKQWCILFNNSDIYYQGAPVCVFDVPRTVSLSFTPANFIDPGTITVTGWDDQFKSVTENVQSNGQTTQVLSKSFKILKSIYFSSYPWFDESNQDTCTVTGSNVFGLPYLLNDLGAITTLNWAGNAFSTNEISLGNVWRSGEITFEDTESFNDARGTIDLSSQDPLPSGSQMLQFCYYVYGNDTTLRQKLAAYASYQSSLLKNPNKIINYGKNYVYGGVEQIVGIRNNVSGIPTLPDLVTQDLYGAQFPADLDFMTSYNRMLAL